MQKRNRGIALSAEGLRVVNRGVETTWMNLTEQEKKINPSPSREWQSFIFSLSKNTCDNALDGNEVDLSSIRKIFTALGIAFDKTIHCLAEDHSSRRDVSVSTPPFRTPHFVGREAELEMIERRFEATHCVAIAGLGGVGKTQLALAYMERFKKEFGSVFWVRAETESEIQQGYSLIANQLKLRGLKTVEMKVQAVKAWMEQNASWLLILDNLDQPEIFKPYLPRTPQGRILITSRAQRLDILSITAPVELGILTPKASQDFLLNRVGQTDYSKEEAIAAATLAEELGYLPLALEQAAAYVLCRTTYSKYLRLYRKHKLEFLEKASPIQGDYPMTVRTTWEINFNVLEKEASKSQTASKHSMDMLLFAAFLAPDEIPIDLAISGVKKFRPALSALLENAADEMEMEEICDDLLEPLTRYSLASKKPGSKVFTLHRMVQAVGRDRLTETNRKEWQECAVRAVNAAFPIPAPKNRAVCQSLQSHANAVCEMVLQEKSANWDSGDLLYKSGRYLLECGQFGKAEPYLKSSLVILRETAGDHALVADCLAHLSEIFRIKGDLSIAMEMRSESLAIRQAVLPAGHQDIAQGLNDLALIHCDLKQYLEAESMFEEALKIARIALPKGDWHIAEIIQNIGLLQYHKTCYAEAESCYKQALEIWGASEEQELIYATTMHNLAQVYRRQGRVEEAEEFYFKALKIQRNAYPQGHFELAITLHNIGLMYACAGSWLEAEEKLLEGLNMTRQLFGDEHQETTADLHALESLYDLTGRSEDAEAMRRRANAILNPDSRRVELQRAENSCRNA